MLKKLFISALVLLAAFSQADRKILLQVPGMQGSVTSEGYEGWFSLESLSFSAYQSECEIETEDGGYMYKPCAQTSLYFNKTPKSDSLELQKMLDQGMQLDVLIHIVDYDTGVVQRTFTIKEAKMESYDESIERIDSYGGYESYSLNFSSIEKTYAQ